MKTTRMLMASVLLLLIGAGTLWAAPDYAELADQLKDPDKAAEARQALIKGGEKAVPHLLGIALEGTDLVARGWAIVCLSHIGGEKIDGRLRKIHADNNHPKLVRTWAAAARVRLADSLDEILDLATLIRSFPPLKRPVGKAILARFSGAKGDAKKAAKLIGVTIQVPALRKPLARPIMALEIPTLVKVMVTSTDNRIRRQATAYLGSLAQTRKDNSVGSAVMEIYGFNPDAEQVPWSGGALFIPGIKWRKDQATALVDNLISWMIWVNEKGRQDLHKQLHNNLRSVNLARVVGYKSPRWKMAPLKTWLTLWGKLVGRKHVKAQLAEQGLADDDRFQGVLNALPEKD